MQYNSSSGVVDNGIISGSISGRRNSGSGDGGDASEGGGGGEEGY